MCTAVSGSCEGWELKAPILYQLSHLYIRAPRIVARPRYWCHVWIVLVRACHRDLTEMDRGLEFNLRSSTCCTQAPVYIFTRVYPGTWPHDLYLWLSAMHYDVLVNHYHVLVNLWASKAYNYYFWIA